MDARWIFWLVDCLVGVGLTGKLDIERDKSRLKMVDGLGFVAWLFGWKLKNGRLNGFVFGFVV